MSLLSEFMRVGYRSPCAVCGREKFCLRARDGSDRAVCTKIESPIPWSCGWFHGSTRLSQGPRPVIVEDAPEFERWKRIADACRLRLLERSQLRGSIAMSLGVTVESLDVLGVGLDRALVTSTWPMRDHLGRVIGVRLRTSDGKRAILGSRNGLFLPAVDELSSVLITEGESDCAAAVSLGFFAIGRPGCTGGVTYLLRWIAARPDRRLVVVADADEAGRLGAQDLADRLAPLVLDVRVVEPPLAAKDLRAALVAGATRADVLRAVADAPRVVPTLRRRR